MQRGERTLSFKDQNDADKKKQKREAQWQRAIKNVNLPQTQVGKKGT